MYWSKEFKYDPIASTMTLKRYETLQRFIHASDNSDKNNPENAGFDAGFDAGKDLC